jgi:ABC-type dipeptide/oligopeptide/nickel transport system permease subunit
MKRFAWNKRLAFGLIVLALMLLAAIAAPWLTQRDPLEQDLMSSFLPPFWHSDYAGNFLLGADSLGRDILSRLLHGARIALLVAFVAALLAGLLGTALGLAAGYFGGVVDGIISRLVEIWMSFPPVLLSIVLAAVIGPGLLTVIVAIAVIDWTRFCRIVRAETLAQRELDYVTSAVIIGLKPLQILWHEILPNIAPLLLVLFSMEMGIAIVVEAILSFVGLSVATGDATWGGMISEGRLYVNQAWWLMALPMLCIIVAVLGMNALGDGLKRALEIRGNHHDHS